MELLVIWLPHIATLTTEYLVVMLTLYALWKGAWGSLVLLYPVCVLMGVLVLVSMGELPKQLLHLQRIEEQKIEQSCPTAETPKDKDDKIKDVLKQIESLEKEVASLTE